MSQSARTSLPRSIADPCGADHLYADRAVPGLRDRHQPVQVAPRRSSAIPLALPTRETFDLVGYQTVLKQGDFLLYFQNSLIVTVVSLFLVLLFGAMAAFALSRIPVPRQHADGALSGARDHDPDPAGHGGDPADDGRGPSVNTLIALILVYTAQGLPLAVFILSEFMKSVSDDLKNAGRIDGLIGIPHLLPPGAAAGASGDGDGGGVHHDPDLERPVVPADPGARRGDQDR